MPYKLSNKKLKSEAILGPKVVSSLIINQQIGAESTEDEQSIIQVIQQLYRNWIIMKENQYFK